MLISVEGSSAFRQTRVQGEELVRARNGEEHSSGLWRIARIDREIMRTSLTKLSAVAPVSPGGNAARKMSCYPRICGSANLVTSVVSSVLRSSMVLTNNAARAREEQKRGSARWKSCAEVLVLCLGFRVGCRGG